MIKDAEQFKQADKDFSAHFDAKSQLETYIRSVQQMISDPDVKFNRGGNHKIQTELANALATLELDQPSVGDLNRAELSLKRAVTKATASTR